MNPIVNTGATGRWRSLIKWCWVQLLSWTGLIRMARVRIGRNQGIVVLTFHRVLPRSQCRSTYSPHGMLVMEETFEALARYVSQHYHVVALKDTQPIPNPGDPRPRLAFTFDDGWIDNFAFAAPIARKYNIPISIFICPSKVGLPMPYWPEQVNALLERLRANRDAARKADAFLAVWSASRSLTLPSVSSSEAREPLISALKIQPKADREEVLSELSGFAGTKQIADDGIIDSTMTWENIRDLQAQGVYFGSHTNSHEILPHISQSDAECELTEGKRGIEATLGLACSIFAYPNGDWSARVRTLVGKAGYQFAFINTAGLWTSATDPLLVPRTNIWEGRLVGPSGRFSRSAFEYAAFWWAYRNQKRLSQSAYRGNPAETPAISADTARIV